MGERMAKADEFIKVVYETIKDDFKNKKIYVKGENGVSNIVLFDEPEIFREKSRYRIAYTSIVIFNDETPLLAIEVIPKAPTPPKDMVGPIPVYMVARKIMIKMKDGSEIEYELNNKDSKFPLLVVIPDQTEGGQKSAQISDLNEKFKGVLDLESEYSCINDFEICEFGNLKPVLNKLINI